MNITVGQGLNFPDTSFLDSVLSVAQVTSDVHYVREQYRLSSSSSSSSSMSLSRLLMASSAAALLACNKL